MKNCNFPTDNCKFPTEGIISAQYFNFKPKNPENGVFSAFNFVFIIEKFPIKKIFVGRKFMAGTISSFLPALCHMQAQTIKLNVVF